MSNADFRKNINENFEEVYSHLADNAAHGGIYHKNLLHNWDFRNPVNQRGVSGTISMPGYFLDRWKLTAGTVTINSDSITLNGTIQQILENAVGTNVKASVLMQSGTATATYDNTTKTFTITSSGGVVLATKLEIGDKSTLATDPSVDYGEQLALCQRFYIKIASGNAYGSFISDVCTIAEALQPIFSVPVTMRTLPTTIINGSIAMTNGIHALTVNNATSSTAALFPHGVQVNLLPVSESLTKGTVYKVYANNDPTAYIAFSAEL